MVVAPQPAASIVLTAATLALVGPVAFVAAALAAVAGFGGAAVLLPALVAAFGVRAAIPILTVAQLVGNNVLLVGLGLGPMMIAGSWAGKRIVDRLPERVFVAIIELTLVTAGLLFLLRG